MYDPQLTHSFVLRIWLESPKTSRTPLLWRGRITNVLEKRTSFVESFRQIEDFVEGYVQQWSESSGSGEVDR